MHKSMEVMQRRNRQLLVINAEQARAIAKLVSTLYGLTSVWEHKHTAGWHAGYNSRIILARELLKELEQ